MYIVGRLTGDYSFVPVLGEIASHLKIGHRIIDGTIYSAVPYISIGLLMSEIKDSIKGSTRYAVASCINVLTVMLYAIVFKNPARNLKILLFAAVVFLAIFCIKQTAKPRKIYLLLRKMSLLIFFTHLLLFQELFYTLCFLLGIEQLGYQTWFWFIVSMVFSIILSVFIIKLSEYKKLRFLKYLY